MGWTDDGYDELTAVAADDSVEIWHGRAVSGEPVMIRRFFDRADAVTDLLARRARVRRLGQQHISVPVEVYADGEDLVIVDPLAAGGSLLDLLATRGTLRVAEVVTIVAPLGVALQQAHEAKLLHGRISTDHIAFAADGRPILIGMVAAFDQQPGGNLDRVKAVRDPRVERGAAIDAPSDVYVLAALAAECLGGELRELAGPLRRALSPECGTAGELAARCLAACSPEPVGLSVGGAPAKGPSELMVRTAVGPIERPGARHRRVQPRRQISSGTLAAAGLLVVIVLFGWIGLRWGGSEDAAANAGKRISVTTRTTTSTTAAGTTTTIALPGSPASLASSASSATAREAEVSDIYDIGQWKAYLGVLYERRATALIDRDVTRLGQVFCAGSAAYQKAATQISGFISTGSWINGFRPRVIAVSQVVASPVQTTLTVLDEIPAYAMVNKSGVATEKPGRPEASVNLVLRKQSGRWLIFSAVVDN